MAQRQFKFNVIFNSAEQSRRQPTEDSRLASEFAVKIVDKLRQFGYNGYNPDLHARLGRSIYKEHFRIVQETDFTIVIVTPEFFTDYWADFKNESAFNYLKQNGRRHKLLPIAVHTRDLRELDVNQPLFFPDRASWEDETKWRRIIDRFRGEDNLVQEQSIQPQQEFGDDILRTDGQNIVARPASAASLLSAMSPVSSLDGPVPELYNEDQVEPVFIDNQNMNSANGTESAHSLPDAQLPQIQNLNINDRVLETDGAPTNVSLAHVPTGVIQPFRTGDGLRDEDNTDNGSNVIQHSGAGDVHRELDDDAVSARNLDPTPIPSGDMVEVQRLEPNRLQSPSNNHPAEQTDLLNDNDLEEDTQPSNMQHDLVSRSRNSDTQLKQIALSDMEFGGFENTSENMTDESKLASGVSSEDNTNEANLASGVVSKETTDESKLASGVSNVVKGGFNILCQVWNGFAGIDKAYN